MEGRSWRGRHGFRLPKCSDRRAADLILPFDTVCHFLQPITVKPSKSRFAESPLFSTV